MIVDFRHGVKQSTIKYCGKQLSRENYIFSCSIIMCPKDNSLYFLIKIYRTKNVI